MCVYVSIYLYVFFVKKQIIILLKFCSILCLILLFSGFDSLMELSSLQQWFRTLVRKQSFNWGSQMANRRPTLLGKPIAASWVLTTPCLTWRLSLPVGPQTVSVRLPETAPPAPSPLGIPQIVAKMESWWLTPRRCLCRTPPPQRWASAQGPRSPLSLTSGLRGHKVADIAMFVHFLVTVIEWCPLMYILCFFIIALEMFLTHGEV